MSDFGTMIARINRELRRDGITADVKDAILTSIDHYEGGRFWFNEHEASANTTTGMVAITLPDDFREMDLLEINVSDSWVTMTPRDYGYIQAFDPENNTGQPSEYAIYRDQIYFDQAAQDVYALNISYHRDLNEVSASASDAATNAWMTDGEAMIRQKAKSIVARDRLRNYELADQFLVDAEREHAKLTGKTIGQISTGALKKTSF